MKTLVQWTLATARGWEAIDSAEWRGLPKRPDPTGQPAGADDAPGWVFGLCVQGVHFTADHYAVESLPGRACRVMVWNDDPAYYPPGRRNARVWTFAPLAPDPQLGGRWNTRQTQVIYAEPDVAADMVRYGVPASAIRPYSQFVPPDEAIVRHGKLVSDELNAAHDSMRSIRGWREWTEGVPPRHVSGGRLAVGARG